MGKFEISKNRHCNWVGCLRRVRQLAALAVLWIISGCSTLPVTVMVPSNRMSLVAVEDFYSVPPAPPTGQLSLAWDDYDNDSRMVGGYYLYYQRADWKVPERINIGKQTTFKITNLDIGHEYTFLITVHDGKGSRESLISNRVHHRIAEDSPRITIASPGVLANDQGVDDLKLRAALVRLPTHGSLVLSASGEFAYTPYDPTFYGMDSFSYQATDGQLFSNAVNVSLQVARKSKSES